MSTKRGSNSKVGRCCGCVKDELQLMQIRPDVWRCESCAANGDAVQGTNEFSVYQFFGDNTSEEVRRFVSAEEATKAFRHYATSVAAQMGMVERVIITDGGDCTVAEWQKNKGITWPPQGSNSGPFSTQSSGAA